MQERKQYWEKIYRERKPNEVSWFQQDPVKSLEFIRLANVPKEAALIDVGGGASVLVDRLLDQGFKDLAVLDIAAGALAYARQRLGARAVQVQWFEEDALKFNAGKKFDFWHDRAVFHFLTEKADRTKYVHVLQQTLKPGGYVLLAAFALDGPEKCSGLPVTRYDASLMHSELGTEFELAHEEQETHQTPWQAEQKFHYFLFRYRPAEV